jgi:hypothetical protein
LPGRRNNVEQDNVTAPVRPVPIRERVQNG